jgi:AcrR family transcriptional regulator
MTAQRADAQRNYAHILAVAEREVAAHGADASLEQIARTAGVGSGTVRRHFPGKRALLEAVFRERIDDLCARASELTASPDPRAALLEWLGALTDYAASARGMATTLLHAEEQVHACSTKITDAAGLLLHRAVAAGSVTPGTTAEDLLALVTGIVLATEHHPDAAGQANRLLTLTVAGISPERG